MSQRRFVLDTADTSSVQQLSNGQWQLLLNREIPCSKLVISNIILPFTFYNVEDVINNEVIIDDVKCYLTRGNYNTNTLLKELKRLIIVNSLKSSKGAIQDTFLSDMKYDDISMKYIMSISGYSNLHLQFTNSCDLFGSSSTTINNITALAFRMPFIANMMSIPAVYIRSNLHSNFIYNTNSTNILFRLPVDKPPGSLLIYQNTSNDQYISINNITSLVIQITDNFGNELNLNGSFLKIEMNLIN